MLKLMGKKILTNLLRKNLLIRPANMNAYLKIIFQPKHVAGTQKNHLNKTVLLSTENIC